MGPKGAFRRPNAGFWRPEAPETSIYKLATQKSKVRNFFRRSPLASACNGQPFSQYLAPLGAKYLKRLKKCKKSMKNCLFWGQNQENEGFKILDSGIPKFSRRRPMPAFSLVASKQKPQHNIGKTLGYDPTTREKIVKK